MKFIICTALSIICLEMACALQCYVCLTPTPGDECVIKKNCSHYHSWCKTTVYGPTTSGFPFTGTRYVVRDCATKCQSSNPNFLGVTRPICCCRENLCNTANGTTSAAYGIMETQNSYYCTVTAAMYSIITALWVTF